MSRIEPARLNDLNGVRELNTLLKIVDVPDFYWDTDPYIESAISENRCFVIKDGEALKCAMIMEHRAADKHCSQASLAIGTLSVRPEFRKSGLGILLVSHAKTIARKDNKRLVVESFLEFRQLSFYKRLGFKEGLRKEYHGEPYYILFIDP